MKGSFRHLTMQQLKVENIMLVREVGTNITAFQTVLAVQKVRFFAKPYDYFHLYHHIRFTEYSLLL